MSLLSKENFKNALVKLGELLVTPSHAIDNAVKIAEQKNAWFTTEETTKALRSLGAMLNKEDLDTWFNNITFSRQPKKVGVILAGNIPLVGFHDVICILATGNIAMIKMSSSDEQLLPTILRELITLAPAIAAHIIYVDRLKDFEAIIATGSNNTSRYFEFYFGKVPNIIRKNRNSVAILTGKETPTEVAELGNDIFDYFGLGCRSVAKIYLPEGYEIKNFFEPLEKFQPIINHFKYNNNYDYNKSIYLVNSAKHFDNGFILLKEDEGLASPLAVLFFEYYNDLQELTNKLNTFDDQIQCVVANVPLDMQKTQTKFGSSQSPKLWDYADDVNTIEFLNSLSS